MTTALAPRPPSAAGSFTFKRGSVISSSASESVEVQTPLKIGDQILIFSQEGQGYVYCEVSRYACVSALRTGSDSIRTRVHQYCVIGSECFNRTCPFFRISPEMMQPVLVVVSFSRLSARLDVLVYYYSCNFLRSLK